MKSFIFLLTLISTTVLHAQLQVVAADDAAPVSYAKVLYRFSDSTNFEFSQSDANGFFSINPHSKTTVAEVKIHAVGFEALHDTIDLNTQTIFQLTRSTNLDVVCVTTQYQPTTVSSAVQKITVINSDQIRKSGSVNLADIITYQTGIRLNQDNILGTSMNIGGISGENVKILIDGVPVIGRLNGSVDLSQINLNNIERIELIEGPLSVNYGTNALAGTLNLITKKETKRGVKLELNPYYENIGNYNFNFSSTVSLKKNSVQISGGRNYFDGWKPGQPFFDFPKETLADTNRSLTWKPKEQYFAEVRYSAAVKGWNINPYARYFDEKIVNRGYPKAPYYESAFDDYYFTKRGDAGLIATKIFKKGKLNTTLAYNHFQRIKNTFLNDLTTLQHVLSETPGAQDTSVFSLINSRMTYNSINGKKFNYEFGLDLSYESAYGVRIENMEQFMGDYAAFATCEWEPLSNFVIKPGLRYAYNTIYRAPLVPSLNIRYKKNNWTFRASAARGFRAPSLKELYFDFVDINHNITGNQDLLSERSMNYNLSAGWMKQTKKNTLFKADASAYYNDINNLITLGLSDVVGSYTYINIGKYKTIGNNLAFTMRHKRVSVQFNGAYIGRYNAASEDADLEPFIFSPEIGVQTSLFLWKDKLSLNAFYKFNGSLQTFYVDDEGSIITSMQDSYQIMDLSFNLKLLNEKLNITAGAKNIFNVTTVNISGQNNGIHSGTSAMNAGRGTSVFMGINYQLDLSFKDHEK